MGLLNHAIDAGASSYKINRNCRPIYEPQTHRIIFNKSRGCMMAVSEVAGITRSGQTSKSAGSRGLDLKRRKRSALPSSGPLRLNLNHVYLSNPPQDQLIRAQAAIYSIVNNCDFTLPRSNLNSNFQSVGEQSGLKAGDGGFQVSVANNTALVGGVIASTQQAVEANRNRFTTANQLSITDVQNTASYSGTAVGISAGFGGGKPSGSAGVGTTSGNAASTTASGITAIAGNTAVRTGDAQTGIKPIFNAERVQAEVNAQVAITQAFGQQSTQAWGGYSNRRFQQALVDKDEQAIACWGPDGGCRSLGHGVLGGLTGGIQGAIGGAATSFAAPHIQAFLIDQGVPPGAAGAITVLTVTGTAGLAGGAPASAAAFNEANNNFIFALPSIAEAIVLGGPIAARACLSSPACLNTLRLGGTALVTYVASVLTPSDLAKIPGFGGGPLPQQPNNTGNSSPVAVAGGTPPLVATPPAGPNNTGGDQTANPTPGGNSTASPATAPLGPNVMISEGGTNRDVNPALLNELTTTGVSFTPGNVVAATRTPSGQVVFLETGTPLTGLQHIVGEHANDFANIGVPVSQIPSVIIRAVAEGNVVGYQGLGPTPRPIYEITVNGQPQRIAITTASNGYIVGANPAGSAR